MLKIGKPHRYANLIKGSLEGLKDVEYLKYLKNESKIVSNLPKNTLRKSL